MLWNYYLPGRQKSKIGELHNLKVRLLYPKKKIQESDKVKERTKYFGKKNSRNRMKGRHNMVLPRAQQQNNTRGMHNNNNNTERTPNSQQGEFVSKTSASFCHVWDALLHQPPPTSPILRSNSFFTYENPHIHVLFLSILMCIVYGCVFVHASRWDICRNERQWAINQAKSDVLFCSHFYNM